MSVADRIAAGGGTILSVGIPGGKIFGKVAIKKTIDGGVWLIKKFSKTEIPVIEKQSYSLKLDLQLFAQKKPSDFAETPFVPDEYWGKKASDYNTPGLKYEHYREYNGKIERSTVVYDKVGRQKYRVDHADHSMPADHSIPHLHERIFESGYSDKGKEFDYHFWEEK